MFYYYMFITLITVICGLPAGQRTLEEFIKLNYHEELQKSLVELTPKSDENKLSVNVEKLIGIVEALQLPKLISEISKNPKINTVEGIRAAIRGYVETLPTYISTVKNKRDDDDLFPNYLDHMYGGFGK